MSRVLRPLLAHTSAAVLVGLLAATPAQAQSGLGGDVNGDAAVSITDALFIAQYVVGLRDCREISQFEVCDIAPSNPDGKCTISDALRMAQCDVGLISCDFAAGPLVCVAPNAFCGDGFVDAGEQCDDGNAENFDSCSNNCEPQTFVSAKVVALDQVVTYNRWGAYQPSGMMYALRRDVVDLNGNPIGETGGIPGQVMLAPNRRPRPLILRVNEGEILKIEFTNLLSPIRPTLGGTATRLASMLVNGMTALGDTHDPIVTGIQGIPPGASTTYYWKAEREGTKLFYSNGHPGGGGGEGGQLALGLFGAVNTEPAGSTWYRSQLNAAEMAAARSQATPPAFINYDAVDGNGVPIVRIADDNGEIVHGDINAIVAYDQPDDGVLSTTEGTFREFSVIFHDEIEANQAFPILTDKVMKGVSDGFAINYGSDSVGARIVANRLGIGPAAECIECPYEEFFLESHANGDPALLPTYEQDPSNVHHSYLHDKVKFRNVHAGPRETHIFHLHAHQWLSNAGEGEDDNGTYLDSQTISPMSNFTYEIQYGGGGNRNLTAGDSIYHCHLYPHFAQGMWALWRVHDVFENGQRRLPDGELGLGTDPLTGDTQDGTPIPSVVPMPGQPMAPMPTYGPDALPGYPFYIAGVAGHRPPQAPLDIAVDGGLPRHVFRDGGSRTTGAGRATFDFHVDVNVANIQVLPHEGTPLEQAAMQFHAGTYPGMHDCGMDTITPEGDPGLFTVNCLPPSPGAPFAEPCPPDETSAYRNYHVSYIELDLLANSAGWHDPQGRINVLDSDVAQYENQLTTADPFFFRANSGECVTFYHTNRAGREFALDDFQVRTPADTIGQHIHLVKFDVTASDGSGNGWNYEDGTFSREAVVERIHASNAAGGSALGPVDASGNPVNVGFDGSSNAVPVTLAESGDFQTTTQRWWADPLLNKLGQDRTIRTVFTHDHFFPSTGQQHGFYNALVVEPAGSRWLTPDGSDDKSIPLDPARGVGTQYQIVDAADSAYHPDHREFMLAVADLALLYTPTGVPVNPPALPEAISTKGGVDVVNYRNEPLGPRNAVGGEVMSSWVNGDPFTEILKAREGDHVQVRVIQGAQQAQHAFNFHALAWPREIADSNSQYESALPIGISEHFECDMGVAPPVPDNGVTDYLYHFGANDHLNDGSWGLMRVFADNVPFDTPFNSLQALQGISAGAGELDMCPPGAPLKTFDVEAWRAADLLPGGAIVYNAAKNITDPNGMLYVHADDVAAYASGAKQAEPFVMRVNAGDCIEVNLINNMPVAAASMHAGKISYDPRFSDGANVGLNFQQVALPGETVTYRWYAGLVHDGTSQAHELGPANLRSFGDVLNDARRGLFGALIVEPQGATYTDPVTGSPINGGTVARIHLPGGGSFKEFVLIYQEELDLFLNGSDMPDSKVDSQEKGFNYRTENFYARLGVSTITDLNNVVFPPAFMMGPIATPLFTADAGEEVRFRVLQPSGGPLQHTFLLGGHDYPDGGITDLNSRGASILAPGIAKTVVPFGGAQAGTWVYRDGTAYGTVGGLWGRFEVQ